MKPTPIKISYFLFSIFLLFACNSKNETQVGNNKFSNPIIHADYSDPDVIRVDSNYFMTSSSFSQFPGLPVLHSTDLINWKIISHAAENYPFEEFKEPQHGKGIWAPSLRYHDGKYWIFFGDPDHGILMTHTEDPFGKWSKLKLVLEGKGLIDASPLWDDDGNAYLVHAWAKSRAGFNSILTVREMAYDGSSVSSNRHDIYYGADSNKTIEGPKFYKIDDKYLILAPAGGVKYGWQTALTSENVLGPYKISTVMEQGSTNINGPHQGGLVTDIYGNDWFIHFQDKDAYGRIVHMNPVRWENGQIKMGIDYDGNGIGEPVESFSMPMKNIHQKFSLDQTSDEFNSLELNKQWQWEALVDENTFSLSDRQGYLRLYSQPQKENPNLYFESSVIGQKFPAESFSVIVKLEVNHKGNEKSGLVILGMDYASISLVSDGQSNKIEYTECIDAFNEAKEKAVETIKFQSNNVFLKVDVDSSAICNFSFSKNSKEFTQIGNSFQSKKGRWVGARICLFSTTNSNSENGSFTDFDFVKISTNKL